MTTDKHKGDKVKRKMWKKNPGKKQADL